MGSLLQCLFCKCCDDDEEEEDQQEEEQLGDQSQPSHLGHMARGPLVDNDDRAGSYQVAPRGSGDEDDDDDDGSCCLAGSISEENAHSAGIREFFNRLRARWRMHDSVAVMTDDNTNDTSEIDPRNPFGLMKTSGKCVSSPLRTASSFDASTAIPTICAEEVVLPGSQLQRDMARAMSLNLEKQDDECVICMESFDPSNPRMPTHCGCGSNKTYFHLPCLYQWIEQSRNCPTCRQKLRWDEF